MSETKKYICPDELTPNQAKWMDRYLLLSKDSEEIYAVPPDEYHEVIEWENGWIDYSVGEDDTLWIWTLYSHQEDSDDGLKRGKPGEAIRMAYKVARENGCKHLEFDTNRETKDWIEATKRWGKLEVVSRQMKVTLYDEEKK
tara:strand:+ start:361 stop:786 length:426 start_codon:yes stop_codon:yes gene_type:complete